MYLDPVLGGLTCLVLTTGLWGRCPHFQARRLRVEWKWSKSSWVTELDRRFEKPGSSPRTVAPSQVCPATLDFPFSGQACSPSGCLQWTHRNVTCPSLLAWLPFPRPLRSPESFPLLCARTMTEIRDWNICSWEYVFPHLRCLCLVTNLEDRCPRFSEVCFVSYEILMRCHLRNDSYS